MENISSKRKKKFFEIAAEQSGVGSLNNDLPDDLLVSLISFLDPSKINTLDFSNIDWNLMRSRLNKIFPNKSIWEKNNQQSDNGFASDVTRSYFGTPSYFNDDKKLEGITQQPNKSPEFETIDQLKVQNILESNNLKKDDKMFEDISELIRNIKKYNDPALTLQSGWIEKDSIQKLTNILIVTLSYLPGMLTIEEIVNSFLFENGVTILENVMNEMPELLHAFVETILNNYTQLGRNRLRVELMNKIAKMHPYFKNRIIQKLSKSRVDCNVACRLAIELLNDVEFVEFIEPLFTNRDSILSKIILRSSGRQVLPSVINRLLSMAHSVVNNVSDDIPLIAHSPWCTRLSCCLVELLNTSERWKDEQIILITKFIFRTSLKPEETGVIEIDSFMDTDDSFLSLGGSKNDSIVSDSQESDNGKNITKIKKRKRSSTESSSDPTPFSETHETFVLAILIAVPFFTQYPPNQTGAVQPPDKSVDEWLDAARKRTKNENQSNSTFGANLLYVHACIMSGKIDELADFASETLKRNVDITNRHQHAQVLKNAFLAGCLSELEVAKRSIRQSVTLNLNDKTDGRLAIHSISALQTSGVFKTYQIDISDWLEKQLKTVTYPANDTLLELIEGFSYSTVIGYSRGLSHSFIQETFEGNFNDDEKLTRRLFVMLYLCIYREQSQRNDPSLKKMIYNETVYSRIPVRFLLTVMEVRHQKFDKIRPRLIARCGSIFPYMLPTAKSMEIVQKYLKYSTNNQENKIFTKNHIEKMLFDVRNGNHSKIMKILKLINKSTLENLIVALPVVLECFLKSLDENMPSEFEIILISLFNVYEQTCPRMLYETAASTWLKNEEDFGVAEIYKIPPLLFRADRRIFNSPPHFSCFIQVVNFFATVIRCEIRLKMAMVNLNFSLSSQHHRQQHDGERKEKEHLTSSYLDSQHSSIIHALIEISDTKRMKDDPNNYGLIEKRKQIRKMVCSYIHRTFIDVEGLMKVMVMQMFPLRQVRSLVEGVPSLFAANGFILEMLVPADPQKRIFAVVLAAEICRKYRVRESLETARICCDIVHSLYKFEALSSSNKVWKHLAPALIIFATEFPSLIDSITRLFNRVLANAKNRLSVRCGLLNCDQRYDEHCLIKMISSFLDRDKKHIENVISK